MTIDDLALQLALAMITKSGVRDWTDETTRVAISEAAREMAISIYFGGEEFEMANKLLTQAMDGTPKQICFADHAADFNPTAANDLRVSTDGSLELDCQLDLTSVANAAARQSTKVDLGENRAQGYRVRAAFELAATPTAGAVVSLYWAPSQSATAANGNPAGTTGADAAYAGYAGDSLAPSVKQLDYIGDFICTAKATATVQVAEVGELYPSERYGSLVAYNNSGAAFHNDAVECHVVFDPIVDEIQ